MLDDGMILAKISKMASYEVGELPEQGVTALRS